LGIDGFATGKIGIGIRLLGGNFKAFMTAMGQKQTWRSEIAMSALPQKADIWRATVGFPLSTISNCDRWRGDVRLHPAQSQRVWRGSMRRFAKCYPAKLGEASSVVLRPAASQNRFQDGMQAWGSFAPWDKRLCCLECWSGSPRSSHLDPGEPVRFDVAALICGVPMKPGNRPPKIKRRQLILGRRWVILP